MGPLMATARPATRPATRKRPPARKVASDFDDPSRAPNKSENAEFKRRAKSQDQELADIYEAGRKEGAGGRAAGSRSAPARKKSVRRRAPAPVRKAARQLQAPITAQVTSGLRILGLMLGLAALLAVLDNAPAVSDAFGGVTRAVNWLGAPRGVPKRN